MSDLIEISRYLHKIEAFTVTPRSSATEVKAIVKQLDEYETTLGERINALRSKGKADPETNKLIMLANAELTRIKSEARKKLSLELSTSMSWSGSVSCSASSFAPSESSATSPDGRPTITPVGVVPAAAVAAAAPATAQIPDALEIPFSELTIGDQIGEGAVCHTSFSPLTLTHHLAAGGKQTTVRIRLPRVLLRSLGGDQNREDSGLATGRA